MKVYFFLIVMILLVFSFLSVAKDSTPSECYSTHSDMLKKCDKLSGVAYTLCEQDVVKSFESCNN